VRRWNPEEVEMHDFEDWASKPITYQNRKYFIEGAAAATAISLVTVHSCYSVKLFQMSKIHPFTRNYLTPLFASSLIIFLIYFVAKGFITINIWVLPLLFNLFIATCIAVLILSKSIEEEDIMLLLAIERRSGLNLAPIKNILKKFV